MNDTESSEVKNEQELNLFDDQPRPEEDVSAAPESADFNLEAQAPESADVDLPAQAAEFAADQGENEAHPAQDTALPLQETSGTDLRMELTKSEPDPVPADSAADDSPVIAPPPPRKKPSPQRPGIIGPRTVGQPTSAAANAPASSAEDSGKPLPHPLQQGRTLGQMLADIRNARQLPMEKVAAATRIRTEYQIELESDELLKNLPTVYISAYVRKLAEVYELRKEDTELLLEKMHGETPEKSEEIPDKLFQSVNEGTLVDEGEKKRIRNITIGIYAALGVILLAIIWLIVLAIVHYAKSNGQASGEVPGTVQAAETPVSQTVLLDESELDALIVPETPSISVLKMSKTPGARETP